MKNRYRIPGLVLLISVCLMPPLHAAKIQAFAGKHADFAHYKTYQWLPPRVMTKSGLDENNPANPVLKESIGRQLSQKGLNEVADGADLQIQTWVLTEQVPQFEAIIIASVSIDLDTGYVSTSDPLVAV